MSDPEVSMEEEPWELEISALLGRMPPVEPPAGFLQQAVDHRPLFAGRTTAVLVGAAAAALVVALTTGVLDRQAVVPAVDNLAARHSSASSGLFGSGPGGPPTSDDPLFEVVDDAPARTPVSLPAGFEHHGTFEAEQLEQAVYASGENAVSVFTQPGRVDWSRLPAEGLATVADTPAWIDSESRVIVLQAADSAVTIVGLTSVEVASVVDSLPASSRSLLGRVREAAGTLSGELGFPSVG